MDNLPNGGKVVIVDDCFQEILPLIHGKLYMSF